MSRKLFDIFIYYLRAKNTRSLRGILEVAVMTDPYMVGENDGCDYDCYFCPKQPADKSKNEKGFRSYVGGNLHHNVLNKMILNL